MYAGSISLSAKSQQSRAGFTYTRRRDGWASCPQYEESASCDPDAAPDHPQRCDGQWTHTGRGMLKVGVVGWIRTLTERSEGCAESRSLPACAVWPVVPAAPLDFRYRNPLTMTTSSRQEPLKWGAGGREGEKLWQKPKCSRRQHIKRREYSYSYASVVLNTCRWKETVRVV